MSPTALRMTCTEAMETFHRVLDGDLMDADDRTRMESHVAVCSECAEKAAQLRELQDLLRGYAEAPLPDEVLQGVWQKTVRSPEAQAPRRSFDWRFAAAAAAVVLVAWVGMRGWVGTQPHPEEELARQTAEEARMVLQLAANALKRSERAAIKEVFTDEISPALRKAGVKWPRRANDAGGEGAEL